MVTTASDIPEATPPAKLGYTFRKWVFEGTTTEATEEAILEKVTEGAELITVKPLYEKDSKTYTVKVKYPDTDRNDDEYKNLSKGSTITLTAPDIEDYKFYCWKLGDTGTVLSYDKSYFMVVSGDVELTAEYVDEDDPDADVQPVITIGAPYAVEAGSAIKVAAMVTRSVPDTYTVVETGIYYTRTGEEPLDSKYVSPSTSNDGVVILNVRVIDPDDEVTMCGYMILSDKATGSTVTLTTNTVSSTYGALTA